jgi:hypothetical protein
MKNRFINSDHLPQVLNLSHNMSVMTWNILKRCTLYEEPQKFYNNGFGIVESQYDYYIRLKKIVCEIRDNIKRDGTIKCIALQEIPIEEDLEVFRVYLNEAIPHFSLITYKTQGFLIEDTIEFQDETNELLPLIGKTSNKIQVIKACDLKFINIHLSLFKSFSSRLLAVNSIISQLSEKTIILGDFNFNILDVEIEGVTKYGERDTTLVYNINDRMQSLNTCDGFIIYEK